MVIDRVVPVFDCGIWFVISGGAALLPDVLGAGTGSDRAGAGSFPGRRDGIPGQAGSGRAQSRWDAELAAGRALTQQEAVALLLSPSPAPGMPT